MASRKKVQQRLTKRQIESQRIAREKAKKKFMRTTWRRCVLSGAGLLCLGGVILGAQYVESGRFDLLVRHQTNAFYQMTADAGFRVEDIFLEGRKATPLKEVTQAIGLNRGDPIFSVSVEELRRRLMDLKRVRYAEIERTLPGTLHIHIIEREPVALWQHEGNYTLIDMEGELLESCGDVCPKLPVVAGEDAPAETPALLTMLAKEPELYRKVVAAQRIGERRWNVRLENGIEVKLPQDKPEDAWSELARMEKEQQVLSRAITVIDMRIGDRIFIKTSPEALPPVSTAGAKST